MDHSQASLLGNHLLASLAFRGKKRLELQTAIQLNDKTTSHHDKAACLAVEAFSLGALGAESNN